MVVSAGAAVGNRLVLDDVQLLCLALPSCPAPSFPPPLPAAESVFARSLFGGRDRAYLQRAAADMADSDCTLPEDIIRVIVDAIAADATDDGFGHMCTHLLCKSQVPFVRDMQTAYSSSSLLTITLTSQPGKSTEAEWLVGHATPRADGTGEVWHYEALSSGVSIAWYHTDYCEHVAFLRAGVCSVSGRSVAKMRFASNVRRVNICANYTGEPWTGEIRVHSFGINTIELTVRGTKLRQCIKLPGVLPRAIETIQITDCRISTGPEFWNISRLAAADVGFRGCTLPRLPVRLRAITLDCEEERGWFGKCAYSVMKFVAARRIAFFKLAAAMAISAPLVGGMPPSNGMDVVHMWMVLASLVFLALYVL